MKKLNYFETLNGALESENLVELWDYRQSINYGETKAVIKNGIFISVYRNDNGRYERPIHYATKMANTWENS